MESTVQGGTIGLHNLAVQDLKKRPSTAASDPGLRIFVPLGGHLATHVAERCQETGLSLSDFVRQSPIVLHQYSDSARSGWYRSSPRPAGRRKRMISPKLLEGLLPQFRSFGAGVWNERRLRFRATIALAEIACQNSG
jgi:hypothetical protein